MKENDIIIKEIKHNSDQVCEQVRNNQILIKSNDQKFEEFKNKMESSIQSLVSNYEEFKNKMESSMQSLDYRLDRNYTEVTEDIAAIKSMLV
jgi:hypothetical protein